MTYSKRLPPVRNLLTVAKSTHFPAFRQEVKNNAASLGFGGVLTNFLDLFPDYEVFESKVDFMTRCEELEMFINQERRAPKETLHSQQD